MKYIITVLVLSVTMITQTIAQPTNLIFRLSGSAPDNTLPVMEQNAKAVFDEINKASHENRNLRLSTTNITSDGITQTLALWAISKFHCVEPAYIENVRINFFGDYQIRNIAVFFNDVEQSQDLVVDFDRAGKISYISIAISKTQYNSIMQAEIPVNDSRNRQNILDLTENIRSAYYRQDINFIEQVIFGEPPLIINGKKDIIRRDERQNASNTAYSPQNRKQFINKLRTAIMAKDSLGNKTNNLSVDFNRISVIKSEKDDNLYLIHLRQKWDSGNYSDEGWLTLIIYFNEQQPIIWKSVWQDANLEENELYNFDCFYNPITCK